MKILRKGDEFRKMPEKSVDEALVIKSLINQGWNYCSRQTYKDFFNVKKTEKKESEVKETKETKASKKKESK